MAPPSSSARRLGLLLQKKSPEFGGVQGLGFHEFRVSLIRVLGFSLIRVFGLSLIGF